MSPQLSGPTKRKMEERGWVVVSLIDCWSNSQAEPPTQAMQSNKSASREILVRKVAILETKNNR